MFRGRGPGLRVALSLLLAALLVAGLPSRSAGAQTGAADESRLALVIGNSGYETAPLANPRNDARAMAKALGSVGFEVMLETDVDEAQMYRAIRAFGEALKRRQGVGLFYYAGHGMQVRGRNYLIPLGADIRAEDEVPYQSIDAGLVLSKMETAGNRLNIAILDACRNNPFARSFRSSQQGLARMEAPSGTLIAYATAPGRVAVDGTGRNSPYTRHLVEMLERSGLTVEQVFKRVREGVMAATDGEQVPWESSSLVGEFYFKPPAEAVAAATPPARPAFTGNVDPRALELMFWESIKDSTDPADFSEYLEQFPDGAFAGLARNRLSQLQGDTKAQRAAEGRKKESEPLALAKPAPEAQKSQKTAEALKIAVFPFSGEGDRSVVQFPESELRQFVQGFLEGRRGAISTVDVDTGSLGGRAWRDGGRRPDVGFITEAGRGLGADAVLTYWYRTIGTPGQGRLTAYLIDVSRQTVYKAQGPWLAKDGLTEQVMSQFLNARKP